MASENFEACMKRVLVYEGGYSNHPRDPGGVTLEGVIQRVYDAYRIKKGRPTRALVPKMLGTPDWVAERNEIYRTQYWNAIKGDVLPKGVDLAVFDGAVNSGVSQSVKWLQRALGVEMVDGLMGDVTIAALYRVRDHKKLVGDICGRRLAFLQQLKTWGTFHKGWSARVSSVRTTGQAMAGTYSEPHDPDYYRTITEGDSTVGLNIVNDESGNAKARPADVSEAPVSVGVGTVGTTTGTITSGVLDPIQTATASLQPFTDAIQIVKYIVIALTIVCAGVTLYGIYRNYKAQRAKDGQDVVVVPEGEF